MLVVEPDAMVFGSQYAEEVQEAPPKAFIGVYACLEQVCHNDNLTVKFLVVILSSVAPLRMDMLVTSPVELPDMCTVADID